MAALIAAIVAIAPDCEAAIAFRSLSQYATPDYLHSFVVTKPAGVVDGDVMVMTAATQDSNGSTVLIPPAGWTLVRKTYLGDSACGQQVLYTWYKVASGEPANYTFSFPTGPDLYKLAVVGILAFSGVDNTNPIDAENGQNNCAPSANVTAPSITTTTADTWLVGGFALNAVNPAPSYTPPGGMTERVDLAVVNCCGGNWVSLEVTDEPRAAVGATGTRVAVASIGGNASIGHLLALRPSTQIYRSVGPGNTTALATGASNAMTISGSTAIFTTALPDKIGVGDAIQYNSSANIGFIHGRTDSTHYTVKTAAGGVPTAASGDTSWSIFRAYTSLASAESGTENTGIAAGVRNFDTWSGGKDLTASNEVWNIAAYADALDTAFVDINGWTTGPANYIRIYTPTSTNEVGISQRHNGTWTTSGYRIAANRQYYAPIAIQEQYVRIDGLQVEQQGSGADGYSVIYMYWTATGGEIRVSNSILRNTGVVTDSTSGGIRVAETNDNTTFKAWNNIIYDTRVGIFANSMDPGAAFYFYDNTVVDVTGRGIDLTGYPASAATLYAKNNLVQGLSTNYYIDVGGNVATIFANNLSEDATSPNAGYRGRVVGFVDEPGNDFHLSAADTAAKDAGTDLSGDAYLPFNTDIDGETRPGGAAWDIGADENLSACGVATIVNTGNATAFGPSGSSASITHGLTINSGDVVVALIATNGNGNIITDNNGGNAFTQAIQENSPASGATMRYAIYYRVAGASEPSSYAWTRSSPLNDWTIVIRVFSGVDTASVWDVAPAMSTRTGSPADGTTATAPSMTTGTAGAMGIVAFFSDGLGTLYSAPTNGYGTLVQQGGARSVASAVRIWATAGGTGTTSATLAPSDDWTAHQVALKPAGFCSLAAPVATAATNIQKNSFSANWNASSGATGYRLDVATDSGFTAFVTGYNNLDVGNVLTYSVSSNVIPGTTYYYRVRAYSALGTSAGSNTVSLATTVVELLSFTASGLDGAVHLDWETGSELRNLGFHLYRSLSAEGPYERITRSVIAGLGSSPMGASYSYVDAGLVNGVRYYYELEDIETTGATKRHGPVEATPTAGAIAPAPGGPGEGGGGGGGGGVSSSRQAYGTPERNSFRVRPVGPGEVELELVTEGFYATAQADGTVRIEIPGFEDTSLAGAPQIPVKRSFVEAVAGRGVRLGRVVATEQRGFVGLHPMAAEASRAVVGRDGTVRVGKSKRKESREFQDGGVYPKDLARLLGTAFQGEKKKARVELVPLRWDSASQRLVLTERLVVRVLYSGREKGEVALGGSRGRRDPGPGPRQGEPLVRLVTRAAGLYWASYDEAFGAKKGGVRVSRLSLSRAGEAVAFHVEPEGEVFGPGSVLFFVSEGEAANPYGKEAVYELGYGPGAVMPVADGTPGGRRAKWSWKRGQWQKNLNYQPALLDAGDFWQWDFLISPVLKSYPFTVDHLAEVKEPSRVEVDLQGGSDFQANPDHHVRVSVNGVPVGEASWDGMEPQSVDALVGAGVLKEGENTLEIENVGDTGAAYSYVFLDKFSLSYPRGLVAEAGVLSGSFERPGVAVVRGVGPRSFVVDVTEKPGVWVRGGVGTRTGYAFRVERGRSYLVVDEGSALRAEVRRAGASGLWRTTKQADYLLIAPREFLGVAQPLLDRRRSEGLVARGVAIEDVWDEFGHGEANPQALRDFLAYAYQHWRAPSVRYVLLLGEGHYDYKNFLGLGKPNWIPPAIVRTTYLWTASDPYFAAVNGEDQLPDLAIGRLTATTVGEAETLVKKVLAFEDSGLGFSGNAVLVSDNADVAGEFEADSDEIAELLGGREVDKIYLRDYGSSMRPAIVDAFDRGAGLMSYVGHGGTALWASENFFNYHDVASLAPQERQPFLMTMNCLNGFFHSPGIDSLSEQLVKAPDKGAVAAFSPSGLSVDVYAHEYQKMLVGELVSGRYARLGDAVLAAQEEYAQSGFMPELLNIYHLFGDPATILR